MAQIDPMQPYGNNARNSTTTPTVEQLLRASDAETWAPSSYSSSGKSQYVPHDPEDVHYQPKKFIFFAKVKEKARRWRYSFTKRKKEGDNTTPSWGVRLEDVDGEDEDPEYLGAPMYESELAPEGYKENARQHPRATPVISDKHILPSTNKSVDSTEKDANRNQLTSLAACKDDETRVAAASQETDKHALESDSPLSPRENNWDKGVSVREYIKSKFEPGEDEKALSQVISEAISPKRATGEISVIEKVKGAVNSLLWREEATQSTTQNSNANSSSSPQNPTSNNAKADMETENTGRILQAN